MLKNSTNYEKFAILSPWFHEIVLEVKKDLKNDHLRKDIQFLKAYFPSKNINKISNEELVQGYSSAIKNKELAENLGDFIANRWLFKHSDVYYFFEEKLKGLSSDFQNLEEVDDEFGKTLMNQASQKFGYQTSYIFSILNSVVFSKKIYDEFRELAIEEAKQHLVHNESAKELESWNEKEKAYELQISRLEERYKDKLLGMQKKYDKDMEALKKQISMLQRKLEEKKETCLVS